MAKGMGTQTGLNAGAGNARQKNQQAMGRAGQAGAANFEFGTELGATGAAGLTGAGAGTAAARQRNQQATQSAATRAGRTGR